MLTWWYAGPHRLGQVRHRSPSQAPERVAGTVRCRRDGRTRTGPSRRPPRRQQPASADASAGRPAVPRTKVLPTARSTDTNSGNGGADSTIWISRCQRWPVLLIVRVSASSPGVKIQGECGPTANGRTRSAFQQNPRHRPEWPMNLDRAGSVRDLPEKVVRELGTNGHEAVGPTPAVRRGLVPTKRMSDHLLRLPAV